MKSWVAPGVSLAIGGLVAGCASVVPPPNDQWSAAQVEVGRAEAGGAPNVPDEKLHLQLAKEDLQKGKTLMGDDNKRAATLIQLASTEAQLASTLAQAAQAGENAQQAQDSSPGAKRCSMSPTSMTTRDKARILKLGAASAALLLLLLAVGCAAQIELAALTEAREEFGRAKTGIAMQLDPTDVHEADVALQKAETAFRDEPNEATTNDLAIIADRRALIAEAQAASIQAQQDALTAKQQGVALTAAQLQTARGQLGQTQMQLQQQQAASAAQAQLLQDLQGKLKDARDTIAKIAAVKDDDRGMVITLQGEVLFKTGKWDLKAGAMAKLDEIAGALKGKEQPIVVYGYTDNVGATDMNMDLSQKRAMAVRDYLATKGIPQDLITGEGKGPADPTSDNTSIEGRASNRRVEIVVKPKSK